jgi:beta-glucanase (GH16 family)
MAIRVQRTSRKLALVGIVASLVMLGGLATGGNATAAAPKRNPQTACSGEYPRPLHQTVWMCTFDDEFNGTSLDMSKWTPSNSVNTSFSSGPVGSRVCYLNNPSTIAESGGYLKLSVGRVPQPFTCGATTTQYIGGSVSSIGKFTQTYGRFEVRARFPDVTVAGLQESLWLWPTNDTKFGPEPTSGEIDIAESYSVRSDIAIPYIHYTAAKPDPSITSANCSIADLTAFHTYLLVWSPGVLTISIDGTTCVIDRYHPKAPLVSPAPFNQPFFVALTQALGVNSDAFDPATTPLPATTFIDYVRVWQLQST